MGLPLQNFCVPREFSSGTNRKNVYHLHPNQNFREFVVNGKQPGILSKKLKVTLFWFTLFVDFFVNSDWLELVVFFYTNEQDGEETPSLSTLRTTAIYDKVVRQDCATFEIEKFLEERLKATEMFFLRRRCLSFFTNWLCKIFNISSRVSVRWLLLSRRNRSPCLFCPR